MADQRLTDKSEITSAADNDWLEIIQRSDTSGNAAGTTKRIQKSNLVAQAPTTFTDLTDVSATTLVGEDGKVPFVRAGALNLQKLPTFEDLFNGNTIIRGGVAYRGSGLVYSAWATSYLIDGTPISVPITADFTLSDGDSSHPRTDVLAIQVLDLASPSPTLVKIEGTASATPVEPTVNLATQVKITAITVPATATTDATAVTEVIYDENSGEPGEWDATAVPAGANMASNVDPKVGSVCILLPAYTSGILELTKASKFTYVQDESLLFYMKASANLTNTTRIQIKLRNSTSNEYYLFTLTSSNAVNYGFLRANTDWQLVQIPLLNFVPNSRVITEYDELEVTFENTPILALDWFVIQGSVPNPSNSITPKFVNGTDPLDAVYMDGNVGIGIEAPDSLLHVHEPSTSSAFMRLTNTESVLLFRSQDTFSSIQTTEAELRFQVAGATIFTLGDESLILNKGALIAPTLRTTGYALSALPTGVEGDRAFVNDATVTYAAAGVGATLTGGGANRVPVFKTNTAWVSG